MASSLVQPQRQLVAPCCCSSVEMQSEDALDALAGCCVRRRGEVTCFPSYHPQGDHFSMCVFVSQSKPKRKSSKLEELFEEKRQFSESSEDRRFHSDVFEIRRRRDESPPWPALSDRRHFTHPAFPGLDFADQPDDEWGWFVASDNNTNNTSNHRHRIDLRPAIKGCSDQRRDTIDTVTSEDLLME